MPEVAENAAYKELKRLKKMPAQMPEHAMIRLVIDLVHVHYNSVFPCISDFFLLICSYCIDLLYQFID